MEATNTGMAAESLPPESRPSLLRVAVFTGVAFAAGIAAVAGLRNTNCGVVSGTLQAQVQVIRAPRVVKLVAILVKPGEFVGVDQPVVELRDEQLDRQLVRAQRELVALQAEMSQLEARYAVEVERRQKDLDAEIFETKLKTAGYLQQRMTAELENLVWGDAFNQLQAERTGTTRQARLTDAALNERLTEERQTNVFLRREAAQNAHDVSQAQVELCEERLRQLDKKSQELSEQLRRSLGVDLLAARIELAKTEAAELQEKSQQLTLKSSLPGVVGVFQHRVGDELASQDSIVEILDSEQRFVRLDVASRQMTDFEPGTLVELKFSGNGVGRGRVDVIPPQTLTCVERDRASHLQLTILPAGPLWPADIPFGSTVEIRAIH